MKMFKYFIAIMFTLFLCSVSYAKVADLDTKSVDKCRQALRYSHINSFAAVLIYSKATTAEEYKLFETVCAERPGTPCFKFDIGDELNANTDVSRLCLGQLNDILQSTLMFIAMHETKAYIPYLSFGFGFKDSLLSNKQQVEAVFDDQNVSPNDTINKLLKQSYKKVS